MRQMNWKHAEQVALGFVQQNYDINAYAQGGSNCHAPDIISPIYGIIEVKSYNAQAGQFTKSTIKDNPLSAAIAAKAREDVTAEEARAWCRKHYEMRGVNYVVIVNKDDTCEWYDIESFFSAWNFKIEKRETKKSGTNALAMKYWNQIPTELEVEDGINSQGRKVKICNDTDLWSTGRVYKYMFDVLMEDGTIRTAGINSNGVVSLKSATANTTWIFALDGKVA